MKVAYVVVDHLAVEVERRSHPELRSRPVVVGGLPHERRPVFDVSTEAARAGVRRGMPLRQAHQLCPDAVFLPPDEAGYRRANAELLDLLEEFSPAVEPDGLDGAYLDAAGLTLLFGEDPVLAARIVRAIRRRLGLAARIGVGPGKFVAWLAARLADAGPVVVAPQEVRRFLARQPAWLLPLGPEAHDRLRRLGLRSVGQFARLPAEDLALQFGAEGVTAHRLARGEDDAPVVPRARPPTLVAVRELEPALADRERFRVVVAHLLADLAGRLQREGRSCRTLALRLELEDGKRVERISQLGEPTDDGAQLAGVACEMLEQALTPPSAPRVRANLLQEAERPGGIVRLEIALEGLGPRVARQLGLFDAQRQRRASLDLAVDRIQRRFGSRVKRVVVADEGAWLPSRRFTLKDY